MSESKSMRVGQMLINMKEKFREAGFMLATGQGKMVRRKEEPNVTY